MSDTITNSPLLKSSFDHFTSHIRNWVTLPAIDGIISITDTIPIDTNHKLFDIFGFDTNDPPFTLTLDRYQQALILHIPINKDAHLDDAKTKLAFEAESLDFIWPVDLSDITNPKVSESLTVSGTLILGGGRVVTGITLPNLIFYIDLLTGETIDLSVIVNTFLGENILPEESLDIMDLEATIDLDEKEYEFMIDIASNWEIPLGGENSLILKETYLEFLYNKEYTQAIIYAVINIAQIDVAVKASYMNTGWEFSAQTGYGQQIPIGHLIEDLVNLFGIEHKLPAGLETFHIENLIFSFSSIEEDKYFYFSCEGGLTLSSGEHISATITIRDSKQGDITSLDFTGTLYIDNRRFRIDFGADQNNKHLVASYKNEFGDKIYLQDMIAMVSDEVASYIPDSLYVNLSDAYFGYYKDGSDPQEESGESGSDTKPTSTSSYLLGADISAGFNLSAIPLVGDKIPHADTVGIERLQLVLSSRDINSAIVGAINEALAYAGIPPLPASGSDGLQSNRQAGNDVALHKGLNFDMQLNLGGLDNLPLSLSSPHAGNDNAIPPAEADSEISPSTDVTVTSTHDDALWVTIQKAIGPFYFDRIGINFVQDRLTFYLDASVSIAGLSLSLEGLSVELPLDHFEPGFDLQGLGLDFKKGVLEIGGAFLRQHVIEKNDIGEIIHEYDEYNGLVILKLKETLSLSAIGSYANVDGHPSMFLYAVLNYPLGGPSFFFVTGLAAGFGYNRSLHMPTIDKVSSFPLVTLAVNPEPMPTNDEERRTTLTNKLRDLSIYVPPSIGQNFLTVGVKFTSFKLIDSFVLVAASFGNKLSFDILGLSTMVLPPAVDATPLAEIQMALKAHFSPDEGVLQVRAQLTQNSFVLSRSCHLTGGFAFYAWFDGDHKGEFVTTLGGYHPQFNIPAHYPRVPRLGFSWQIDSHMSLKGGMYCALCPHVFMAGGYLEAVYHSGSFKAWFNAGADFLIAWQPYHYDAHVYVQIGASLTYHFFGTHHITIDASADVHIWGPEFSGDATVHIWVVSKHVSFGGDDKSKHGTLSWPDFQTSFLPDAEERTTFIVQDGLVSQVDPRDGIESLGIVNPKHLQLVVDCVLPSTKIHHTKQETPNTVISAVMGVNNDSDITSELDVTLEKVSKGEDDHDVFVNVTDIDFELEAIPKKVPASMWGHVAEPGANDPQYVDGALSGVTIKPKHSIRQLAPEEEKRLLRKGFAFDHSGGDQHFNFKPATRLGNYTLPEDKSSEDAIIDSIQTNTDRDNLLKAIGKSSYMDIDRFDTHDLVGSPVIYQ